MCRSKEFETRFFIYVQIVILCLVILALSACSKNSNYGGLNYGEVTTPEGEKWIIIGGKDETDIEFIIHRPDGTKVEYRAEQSNSTEPLTAAAEAQKAQAEAIKQLIDKIP